MAKVKDPTKPYSGRNLDARVVNVTLDEEVMTLLQQFCPPGRKSTGRFFSRLVYEHNARLQEQKRLQQALQAAMGVEELAPS